MRSPQCRSTGARAGPAHPPGQCPAALPRRDEAPNPAQFEALHFFISAVQAVVPEFDGPPQDEPMLEFQVADPDVLRQRLTDAGLTAVAATRTTRNGSPSGPDSSCGTGASAVTRSRVCWSPISPRGNAQTSSGCSTAWSTSATAAAGRPCSPRRCTSGSVSSRAHAERYRVDNGTGLTTSTSAWPTRAPLLPSPKSCQVLDAGQQGNAQSSARSLLRALDPARPTGRRAAWLVDRMPPV